MSTWPTTWTCRPCGVRWSGDDACWLCGRTGEVALPLPVGTATWRASQEPQAAHWRPRRVEVDPSYTDGISGPQTGAERLGGAA